jgi:23S rRNA pseudouridine2605 synthase
MSSLESAMQKSTLDPADPSLAGIEERVAKRIARCGLCSRREAEKWITEGRVKVDGELILEPGTTVRPGQVLAVDDIPIRAEPPKLFIFNKVRNMLITRSVVDEKKRETLGQLLTEMGEPTLLPVGRLDYTSEGLLLLTNDGELKRYLEHPDSNIQRTYRVRIYGRVTQDRFRGLEKGITIDGFAYRGVKVTVENAAERPGKRPEPQRNVEHVPPPELRANTWLRVELHEGKNREIRRIMEHYGLEVSRLIRIQYGPYKLSREIESGVVAPVPILDELKPHTNQAWNWHPKQESKPSLAERLKMPKSNEPPRRKKQATSEPMEEPL